MLTKGAIGNLINRYRAVLTKCNLINTFGSLAVASMLVLGGASVAEADMVQYTGETGSNPLLQGTYSKVECTVKGDFSGKERKYYGGIAWFKNSNVTIDINNDVNSQFKGNRTYDNKQFHGGVFYVDSSSVLNVYYSDFNGNSSSGHGGAVGYTSSSGVIENCNFENNSTSRRGGAIYASNSVVTIKNTYFEGNHGFGGGVICSNGGDINFENVNFVDNYSEGGGYGGGVIYVEGNTAVDDKIVFKGINNFIGNESSTDGGVIYNNIQTSSYDSYIIFAEDSINTFNGNVSKNKGGAIFNNINGQITFNGDTKFLENEDIDGKNDIHNNGQINFVNDASITCDGGISSTPQDDGTYTGTIDGVGYIKCTKTYTKVQAKKIGKDVKIVAAPELNDQLGGNKDEFRKQIEGEFDGQIIMEPGMVAPGYKDGRYSSNPVMDVLQQASITTFALDRILTNDVRKRLGDIRSDANTTGVWMRWDGGKLKGDAGLTNNFNTIQIGGDTKTAKNCRIGFAGSFTHGDAEFISGNGELEGFSFALYGTWMGENGMFADVVARLGKFSTEMSARGRTGDMDNRVASLSGEYGWRLSVCDQFFVEPQVELAYTYVSSDDLQLGEAHYEFEDVDSLIGRAGLVAGWNLPDERGNMYARASVVRQFMGDAKVTGVVTNGVPVAQERNGEDTWLEYGIGANVKLTDNTYVWADVERTAGADIDEEWRGTVGIRYSF